MISITASCWHVRKPTTETIALWRRVSRVPMSFYFRIGERKLRSLWADSTNFSTSKEIREYCIQKIIIESIIIFRDLPFVDPNRNSKDFLRAPPQPFRGVAATPHRSFAASAVLSLHHNPPKYYAVTFLFACCFAVHLCARTIIPSYPGTCCCKLRTPTHRNAAEHPSRVLLSSPSPTPR